MKGAEQLSHELRLSLDDVSQSRRMVAGLALLALS